MKESAFHRRLKDLAAKILKSKGCIKIEEEYRIIIDGKRYIVDVVGIDEKGRKIAIECGQTSLSKVMALKNHFNEVIVIDKNNLVDFYEGLLRNIERKINEKEKFPPTPSTSSRLVISIESKESYMKRLKKVWGPFFDAKKASECYDKWLRMFMKIR